MIICHNTKLANYSIEPPVLGYSSIEIGESVVCHFGDTNDARALSPQAESPLVAPPPPPPTAHPPKITPELLPNSDLERECEISQDPFSLELFTVIVEEVA